MTTPAAVRAMLGARSVAVVGASARPDTFGHRLLTEVLRSPSTPRVHLVNPRYDEVLGRRCLPSLDEIPEPVDLALLAVPDAALDDQISRCAGRGDRSAVVFGNVSGPDDERGSQRDRIAAAARAAGMALCGGGCMGFVNVSTGVRAIGYLERSPLPAGPVALVTHSGSAFSALLRTRRPLGFTVAVSSGQELVTTAADYLDYALDLGDTRVVGLLLEAPHGADRLVAAMLRAAAADVPVVLLPVGRSATGRALVAAHSGAVAGGDAGWEALCDAGGALRVRDLDELVNTLELFASGVRARVTGAATGIATVHDSGAERTLTADLAADVGVPFAQLSATTHATLERLLDPGLVPGNPLDVWGTGADTRELLGSCLRAMATDPAVAVTALSVDLVAEYDGDTSYVDALLDVHAEGVGPLVVLTHVTSAVDGDTAAAVRSRGIPVLEGTATGLVALRRLLDHAARSAPPSRPAAVDPVRQEHWRRRLAEGPLDAATSFALLSDYGITTIGTRSVATADEARDAAAALGYPVALKTDEPSVAHKSDVGGVVLGLPDDDAVAAAYDDLADRLGPRVSVSRMAAPGVELAVGMVADPAFGPLVVVAAGGVLVEALADRAVALPPVDGPLAARLVDRLRCRPLLDSVRGAAAADLTAVSAAIVAMSRLASELGADLAAVDVNPLLAAPSGAVAVDALVVPAQKMA